MTAFAPALTAALLHFLWQGIAVSIIVTVALALLRHRSAQARYLTACAGLAIMAALPIATTVFLARATQPSHVSALSVTPHPMPPVSAAPLSAAPPNWILRLWALGVLIFALRLALSYSHIHRLRRSGEPADPTIFDRAASLAARMNIARPVAVLISRVADCPSVTGWLRPAILIPMAVLAGLDVEQLEAILAHELAHIRRHDYLVNLLQTGVETLLFYHPAVWWLSARIRREREFCCDDLALRYTGAPMTYARALTRLERLRTAPAFVVAANGGPLLARIRRIMGEGAGPAPSRVPALAALLIAALCTAVTLHWAHGQSQSSTGVLSRAPLTYPEAARAKGVEGAVLVEVTLNGNGAVTDARVLSGPAELRTAALRSILDWRFANAVADEVRQVPVDFTKDMPDYAKPGFLVRSDELNDRLTNAQQPAKSVPNRDEIAALRAQMQELEAQLAQQRTQSNAQLTLRTPSRDTPEFQMDQVDGQLAALRDQLRQKQEQLQTASQSLGRNNPTMKELQAQVLLLQAQIGRLAELPHHDAAVVSNDRQDGDTRAVEQTILMYRGSLRQAQAELEAAKQAYVPDDPTVKQIQARVETIQEQIQFFEKQLPQPAPADFTNRRLAHITLTSPMARVRSTGNPQLMSQMIDLPTKIPVQIGETLTPESLAKLDAWAHSVKGLTYELTQDSSGDVTLHVSIP